MGYWPRGQVKRKSRFLGSARFGLTIDISSMKIRTNIYLTGEQHKKLAGLSKKTLAPVAALIRKAIDEFLKQQT